jgi:putative transposase
MVAGEAEIARLRWRCPILTSANANFNESLDGSGQTGFEEVHVATNTCVLNLNRAAGRAGGFIVARLARVIALGVPHHVTQRGNARRFILDCDADRTVYLNLLRNNLELHGVGLIGYCLMSNHIHLVVTPHAGDGLALALKHTHRRYAIYWNATHQSSGHTWQGRYYSCPLDRPHLWEALRYAELNPVRAVLATQAEEWIWSSAVAHCGTRAQNDFLDLKIWREQWTADSWRRYLAAGEMESNLAQIRRCTHTGRPLGSAELCKLSKGR